MLDPLEATADVGFPSGLTTPEPVTEGLEVIISAILRGATALHEYRRYLGRNRDRGSAA